MIALLLAVVVCCATVQSRQGVWTGQKNAEIQTAGNAIVRLPLIRFKIYPSRLEDEWIAGQITYRQYLDERLAWQRIVIDSVFVRATKYGAPDVKPLFEYVIRRHPSLSAGWTEHSKPTDSIEHYGYNSWLYEPEQRKDWRQCLNLYAYALRAIL